MFRDRISRATVTQSMFGMPAPSVEIAGLFQESDLHVERGGKGNKPRFCGKNWIFSRPEALNQ